MESTVGYRMAWPAGVQASQCGRATVGSKPGGLDSWVGRLVGRRASDALKGGWNRCDPGAQAVGCWRSAEPVGAGEPWASLGV